MSSVAASRYLSQWILHAVAGVDQEADHDGLGLFVAEEIDLLLFASS